MVRKTVSKTMSVAEAKQALAMPTLPQELLDASEAESKDLQKRLLEGGELGRIRMTRTGKFVVDGEEKDEVTAVIVGYRANNSWWPGKWTEGADDPPHCAAVSRFDSLCDEVLDQDGRVCGAKGCHEHLVPFDEAPDRQADSCSECNWNEFGTADNGRGKACKNQRTLGILFRGAHQPSADGDEPKIHLISVPPTGIQRFDAYIRANSAELGFAFSFGYETTFGFHPAFDYATPVFTRTGILDSEEINYYFQRSKGLSKLLERAPIKWEEQKRVAAEAEAAAAAAAAAAKPKPRKTRTRAAARA